MLLSSPSALAAPSVLVTVKPVHSLVAGIMEGVGEPALLLPAGASPHSYSLRPSDARKLARADLIIRVGPALETFLARPLANIARRAHVITLMRDNGRDADPHIWLDPDEAGRIVTRVTAALGRADPDNAQRYDENGRKTRARINRLDAEIAASLKPVRSLPYIVFHDGYRYFEQHYGLNHVAAIAASPDRKPGARRLRGIRDIIRAEGAKCVFTEPQFSPSLARALTRDADVRLAALDPLGVDIAPGPDGWFKMMRRLAGSLRACLSDG